MRKNFTTRFNDFIIVHFGRTIYPEEIEKFYTNVAPVKEMCVFPVSGTEGARRGSKVLWAVVQPDLDKFREFGEVNLRLVLKERFDNVSPSVPFYKKLNGFSITLEDLPHSLFGRLNRRAVRKIYEPRVLAGIEGALPAAAGNLLTEDLRLAESEAGIKILECLTEQSGVGRPIIPKDSLELDLGIDSLGRIELVSRLESAFNSEIKIETVSRAFSVKDLILEITFTLQRAKNVHREVQGIPLGVGYWKETLRVLPKNENLEMLGLDDGLFGLLLRSFLTAVDSLILKVFFKIKAEGRENVPKEGACILYANHTSFLDGPAIAACLPRVPVFQPFYFAFGPYFFRPFEKSPVLRISLKLVRLITFDYSTHFIEALRSCYLVLQKSKGLCYFPEGMRSSTGKVGEFRRGFGILAKESKAKLVPVAIEGAHEAWASTAKYPQCYPIRVRFGKPLLPEDMEKEGSAMGVHNSYDAIGAAARRALMELKERK